MLTPDQLSALDRGAVVRWTPALKEELVLRFERGHVGLNDLLRLHSLTLEEFDAWRVRFRAAGRAGLKSTAVQQALPGLAPRRPAVQPRGTRHG